MNERQFIPREEGDLNLTAAEIAAQSESNEINKKGMSGIAKIAGVAAIVGAGLLHPEAANAQQQAQEKQKVEEVETTEQRELVKYRGWLVDMATEEPSLEGAIIKYVGHETSASTTYSISLKNKISFAIRTEGSSKTFTHEQFVAATKEKLHYWTDRMSGK